MTSGIRPGPGPRPGKGQRLPEDVLRGSADESDLTLAPTADIETVVGWLRARGDKIEIGGGGRWRVAGSPRWSDRDLVRRANAKRRSLGLPPFTLRRG